jgi:GTPase SAR1 family protein
MEICLLGDFRAGKTCLSRSVVIRIIQLWAICPRDLWLTDLSEQGNNNKVFRVGNKLDLSHMRVVDEE